MVRNGDHVAVFNNSFCARLVRLPAHSFDSCNHGLIAPFLKTKLKSSYLFEIKTCQNFQRSCQGCEWESARPLLNAPRKSDYRHSFTILSRFSIFHTWIHDVLMRRSHPTSCRRSQSRLSIYFRAVIACHYKRSSSLQLYI